MAELEARRDALRSRLAASEDLGIRLHPNMAEYYRAQIADLRAALTEDGRHREAAEIVRKLVDRIELNPVVRNGGKTLSVSLYGRLAGILAMATKTKAPLDESDAPIRVTKLVAGVRREPSFLTEALKNLPGLRLPNVALIVDISTYRSNSRSETDIQDVADNHCELLDGCGVLRSNPEDPQPTYLPIGPISGSDSRPSERREVGRKRRISCCLALPRSLDNRSRFRNRDNFRMRRREHSYAPYSAVGCGSPAVQTVCRTSSDLHRWPNSSTMEPHGT